MRAEDNGRTRIYGQLFDLVEQARDVAGVVFIAAAEAFVDRVNQDERIAGVADAAEDFRDERGEIGRVTAEVPDVEAGEVREALSRWIRYCSAKAGSSKFR